MLAVWLGPCIVDRIRWSQPGVCIWEPSKNKEFVIFVAVVGHHTPCAIIIFCYYKIYMLMRAKRRAIAPQTTTVVREEAELSSQNQEELSGGDVKESPVSALRPPVNTETTVYSIQVICQSPGSFMQH